MKLHISDYVNIFIMKDRENVHLVSIKTINDHMVYIHMYGEIFRHYKLSMCTSYNFMGIN